jgi:hypothetical protein
LREYSGQGPADPLRHLVKQRDTMVKRRVALYAGLDALVELLGPAWYAVLGSNYGIAALEYNRCVLTAASISATSDSRPINWWRQAADFPESYPMYAAPETPC